MSTSRSAMETFFRNFEHHTNSGTIGPLICQFANVFMVGGVQGAQVVQADAFALGVPKRKKIFDDMGCQSTELVSLHETELNGQYMMVETRWRMTFASADQETDEIQADSTFIVLPAARSRRLLCICPMETSWRL